MKVSAVACLGAETVLRAAHGGSLQVIRVLDPVVHVLVGPVIKLTSCQDWIGFAPSNGGSKFLDIVAQNYVRRRLQVSGERCSLLFGERPAARGTDRVACLGAGQIKFLFECHLL